MRTALAALVLLTLVSCAREEVAAFSDCEYQLGASEVSLERARANQVTAERKAAALEAQLKDVQEQLALLHSGAARKPVVATPSPAPEPEPEKAIPMPPAPGGPLRVGLSLPARRERWVKDKLTMLTEARKRGITLLVQVTDDDADRQVTQCDDLISQGIKVLILAPVDAAKAGEIVEKAHRAGVRVISYDRLVMNSPLDYTYVSFDGIKVGEIMGEFLTKKAPRGTYFLLNGSPTDNNAKLFRQGAMTYIKPLVDRGQIKVAVDQFVNKWAGSEAEKICEQTLKDTHGQVDAVLAATDDLAAGCLQAIEPTGLVGKIPVTGQDANLAGAVRILNGTQSMTIFKDTRNLAKKAIEIAVALAAGKPIKTGGTTINNGVKQVPAVLLNPVLVTKWNLDDVLIKSGYLNREAVYRK